MKPRLTQLERAIMAKLTDADVVESVDRRGGTVTVIELAVSALVFEALDRFSHAAGTDVEGYVLRAVTEAVERGGAAA